MKAPLLIAENKNSAEIQSGFIINFPVKMFSHLHEYVPIITGIPLIYFDIFNLQEESSGTRYRNPSFDVLMGHEFSIWKRGFVGELN